MARNTDDPTASDAEPKVTDLPVDDAQTSSDVTSTEPSSMLEAVEQAMGTPSGSDVSETGGGKTEAVPAVPGGTGDGSKPAPDKPEEIDPNFLSRDPTEQEVGLYSRKAQIRIRDLVEQRNHAAQRAQRVEPVFDFLTKNDIPQEDLGVILDLTARLRHGDFAGFLTGVQPYIDLAKQYTGQTLPPDLAQKVREGYVSPEIAQELAQRRAQEQVLRSQHEHERATTGRELVQTKAETIRNTVTAWEQQVRAQDPDYGLKAEFVRRTAQALMQEHGVPQTPQQAVAYANRAYAEVTEQTKRLRPAPRATAPVPRATSAARGNSTPSSEPKSMFEAAMFGLDAHRGGK